MYLFVNRISKYFIILKIQIRIIAKKYAVFCAVSGLIKFGYFVKISVIIQQHMLVSLFRS